MGYISDTIKLAINDIKTPTVKKVWITALAISLSIIMVLWQGLITVAESYLTSWSWIQWLSDNISFFPWSSFTLLGIVFILFPNIMMGVQFVLSDWVIAIIEKKHYNQIPKNEQSIITAMKQSAIFSARMLGYNIVLLPIYLILMFLPPLSIIVYCIINGWLFAKEYLYTVGGRYNTPETLPKHWKRARFSLIMYGTVLAGALIIPVVNLFVPIIGLIGVVHLWHNHPKIKPLDI